VDMIKKNASIGFPKKIEPGIFFEGEIVGKIPTAIFIKIKRTLQFYKLYRGLKRPKEKKERKKKKEKKRN
jgi:hypothetical protein